MWHREVLLACAIPLLFAAVAPLTAQRPEWVEFSADEAASHLLKKVEPVYPPFAKAAGVQGTVTLHVGISGGRIGSFMERTGPPSLYQAAEDAALHYIYKPFERDGHAVAADTTVAVVFQLPGHVPPPSPPPDISGRDKSFERYESSGAFNCTACVASISPKLRKWLAADLRKQVALLDDGSESSREFLSLDARLRNPERPLPAAIEVIPVPVKKKGRHLYLFRPYILSLALCGDGNCLVELIEEDASGIRTVVRSDGGGYAIVPRSESPYPDIFIYSHLSAAETVVAGYVNVGGLWGQLYCGEVQADIDVHVCQ